MKAGENILLGKSEEQLQLNLTRASGWSDFFIKVSLDINCLYNNLVDYRTINMDIIGLRYVLRRKFLIFLRDPKEE